MIKPFDFYFDFVSPYSFLAHKEIRKIERKTSIKVRYKPILLGGLHNLHGIKAPAFIPCKLCNPPKRIGLYFTFIEVSISIFLISLCARKE